MNLFDVVRAECLAPQAAFEDKAEALAGVARLAKQSPALDGVSEAALLEGLKAREALGSTGFGRGVAIPHCRVPGIEHFVVGLLTLRRGLDFDALDGQPVHLMAFIVAPARESDAHIRLLSALSQTLRAEGVVDELLAATTPEALHESFLRHTRDEVPEPETQVRNLMHVFVLDEGLFREILPVFTALSPDSVAVIEGQATGVYLARLPLFAGFWTDTPERFLRIIVGAVSKGLTNETIRRIEAVSGPLHERDDVLVTVQELLYCQGRLST